VNYQIYNYSEFNSVAYKLTDAAGHAALTAGLGDMMVYASKDGRFGFAKVSYGKDEAVSIALEYGEGSAIPHQEMEVVPPVENAQLPEVTEEQRAENTRRMEYEDSLRNAYVATFHDHRTAAAFAGTLGKEGAVQENRIADLLVASRGNRRDISAFLAGAAEKGRLADALNMLESLAEKDLRDTPEAVLDDHLYNV
jgi:hypothetical protein